MRKYRCGGTSCSVRKLRPGKDGLDPDLDAGRKFPAAVKVPERVPDRLHRVVDEAEGEHARRVLVALVLGPREHGSLNAWRLLLVGEGQEPDTELRERLRRQPRLATVQSRYNEDVRLGLECVPELRVGLARMEEEEEGRKGPVVLDELDDVEPFTRLFPEPPMLIMSSKTVEAPSRNN